MSSGLEARADLTHVDRSGSDASGRTGCLPWRKFLPVSLFSEWALPKPRMFPAMTSHSWMCLQIPPRRSSRRHPQMESLHLLLQAHQPLPRPSLGDTGNVHAQRHQLQWRGQDLTFLRFLGFLSGFFFSQPRARIPYPVSPHPSPCSDTPRVRSSANTRGRLW